MVSMVLFDLQKAFDTVDHMILTQIMEALGLQNSGIEWFQSYLYEGQLSVEIGGTVSKPATVTPGVPQGSILGPLLFLIYINDIPSAIPCKMLLYADDLALIVSGNNARQIQYKSYSLPGLNQ